MITLIDYDIKADLMTNKIAKFVSLFMKFDPKLKMIDYFGKQKKFDDFCKKVKIKIGGIIII